MYNMSIATDMRNPFDHKRKHNDDDKTRPLFVIGAVAIGIIGIALFMVGYTTV